jgi:hypothetical protein
MTGNQIDKLRMTLMIDQRKQLAKATIEQATYKRELLNNARHFLRDPDPSVRAHTLSTAAETFWRGQKPFAEACGDLYPELARDPDPEVRAALAKLRTVTPELRLELAQDSDIRVRRTLASTPFSGPGIRVMRQVWQTLAKGADRECLIAMLSSQSRLPRELLDKLACDRRTSIRAAVASSRSTPPELLATLSKDASARVVGTVAANPKSPQAVIKRLSRSSEQSVLREMLKNKAITIEVLRSVLRKLPDKEHDILMENPALSDTWLRQLGESLALGTRIKLAEGIGADPSHILQLNHDPSEEVRMRLTQRLLYGNYKLNTKTGDEIFNRSVNDPSPAIRLRIVDYWFLGSAELLKLSQDPAPSIRAAVADRILNTLLAYRNMRNPSYYRSLYITYRSALLRLSKDPSPVVRLTIAQGEEIPSGALGTLFKDEDPEVSKVTRKKTRFPYTAVLDLELNRSWSRSSEDKPNSGTFTPSPAALDYFSKGRNPGLRLLTAKYYRSRVSTLKHLSKDKEEQIRLAAFEALERRNARREKSKKRLSHPPSSKT